MCDDSAAVATRKPASICACLFASSLELDHICSLLQHFEGCLTQNCISKHISIQLYTLTYGTIHMKDEWKTFIDNLKKPAEFLHHDEFLKMLETRLRNMNNVESPSVFLSKDERINLLVTSDEINRCNALRDLMNLIVEKLSSI